MGSILAKFSQTVAGDGFGYVNINSVNGKAIFTTSNPSQTISMEYAIDHNLDGSAIVEASRFLKLVRTFTGLVTLETKGSTLMIRQGKTKCSLQIANNPIVSRLDRLPGAGTLVDLGDHLGKIAYALDNTVNTCLAYYWLNNDAIATSNGYVMTEVKLDQPIGLIACVPPLAIRDLRDKVTIRHTKNQLDIATGNFYLSTRLVDLAFPPYRNIIPTHVNCITLDRKGLLEILKRAELTTDLGSVTLGIKGSELYLKAASDIAEDEDYLMGAVTSDFTAELRISTKYITTTLNSIGGQTVEIYIGKPTEPVVFKSPDNPSVTYLIMPVYQA